MGKIKTSYEHDIFDLVAGIQRDLDIAQVTVTDMEYETIVSNLIDQKVPQVIKLDMVSLANIQKKIVNRLAEWINNFANQPSINSTNRKEFDRLRIAEKLIEKAKTVRKESYKKADMPMERNIVEHGVFSATTPTNIAKNKRSSGEPISPTLIQKTSKRFMELRNDAGTALTMFDAKVMLALQKIWSQQKDQTLRFTYYDICKMLGIAMSGSNYKIIEESILNLYRVDIVMGEYRERSGEPTTRVDHYRILQKVSSEVGTFERRANADVVEVMFSNDLYQAIQNGYLLYLNLNIINDLTTPTAQGLYMFFLSESNEKRWDITDISDYLGLSSNRPSKVIDIITSACEQLKEVGVLDDYSFDIPENRKANKFLNVIPGSLLTNTYEGGIYLDNSQSV